MYSFNYLKQFHLKIPNIKLERLPHYTDKYEHIKKNYGNNYEKYLFKKVFKNNCNFSFLKNEFPYDLEKGLKHYVFWINPCIEQKINTDIIDYLISKKVCNGDYIAFENPINNRSIKSIRHFHVIINE